MSTLAEIEAALEALPKMEQEKLFHYLAARFANKTALAQPGASSRYAGLHASAWEISADFDDSLPDEFWTRREV